MKELTIRIPIYIKKPCMCLEGLNTITTLIEVIPRYKKHSPCFWEYYIKELSSLEPLSSIYVFVAMVKKYSNVFDGRLTKSIWVRTYSNLLNDQKINLLDKSDYIKYINTLIQEYKEIINRAKFKYNDELYTTIFKEYYRDAYQVAKKNIPQNALNEEDYYEYINPIISYNHRTMSLQASCIEFTNQQYIICLPNNHYLNSNIPSTKYLENKPNGSFKQ